MKEILLQAIYTAQSHLHSVLHWKKIEILVTVLKD